MYIMTNGVTDQSRGGILCLIMYIMTNAVIDHSRGGILCFIMYITTESSNRSLSWWYFFVERQLT